MENDFQKTNLFEDSDSSEGIQQEKKIYHLKSKEVITKSLNLFDYDILIVHGEVTIKCPCPIIAPTNLTIKGKPGSKLILINTEECQPCIGGKAHTGMSYGRWTHCYVYTPETLIIKGVEVICESVVDNFTIGSYNHDRTTDIKCYNGSIECPEMKGVRHLVEKAEAPQGSTKISMYPTYVITPHGEEYTKPFTDSQLRILDEFELSKIPTDRITADIKTSDMRRILKYARLGMDVTPAYDNYEHIKGHVGIYLGALYVSVDKDDPEFKKYMLLVETMGYFAESSIDEIKRRVVCKNIYTTLGKEYDLTDYDTEGFLKDYVKNNINLAYLTSEELQTWWELIPSMKYINYGSVLADAKRYYEG